MKSLRRKIESLNLNFTKEIVVVSVVDFILLVLIVLSFIVNITPILSISLIVSLIGFTFFYFNRYDSLICKKEKRLDHEFIDIFSYLRIYLFNQETVYGALNNILEFSSPSMRVRIEKLLEDIDEDKSIEPFINFARQFKNKVIEEVMIALYEMVNSGNKDIYLNQFIKVFEDFKNRNEIEAEEKRYRFFDTINMLSIIGSAFIMIILSFSIISLLGEVMNGF